MKWKSFDKNLLLLLLILSLLSLCKPGTINTKEDKESLFTNFGLLFNRSNRLTVSGSAVKGIIKNGKVSISTLGKDGTCNSSRNITSGTTDTNGFYSITYDKTGGMICVTISGEQNTTMYDEKTAKDLSIPSNSNFKLVSILPESKFSSNTKKNTLLSPFSKLLSRRMESLIKQSGEGGDISALYRKASKEVVIRFGLSSGLSTASQKSKSTLEINPSISDSDYPELDDLVIELDNPNSPISAKAFSVLAGFSQLANSYKKGTDVDISDIDAMIDAFASDFEDGVFDGKNSSGNTITVGSGQRQLTFSSTPLTTILLPAISTYLQEGGKLNVGVPGTPTSTITVTQFTNQTQFNDNTPILSTTTTPTNTAPVTTTPTQNTIPPKVLSLTPTNNSTNVLIGTPITIVFDKPMDLTTLTMISTDGTCTGNIQLSSNNFITCMGGTVSLSADQLTVSITPKTSPCVESTYTLQFKVSTGVKDTTGNPLTSEFLNTTTFQTQQAFVRVGVSGSSNIVNALAVSCNTLYVGGNFTTVGSSTRNNIAAINLATGLESSVNIGTNGTVNTILINAGIVYIGGIFTNAGGQGRNNVAAIDPLTGTATPWNPNGSGQVMSLVYNGATVYAGGAFTTIGGQARNRIAELDLTNGNATAWNPNASLGTINTIAYDATNVYLGGNFTSANIGGQTYTHLAAVSRSTGAGVAGWCPTTTTFPVSALVLTGGVLFAGGAFGGNLCSLTIYNFGGLNPANAASSGYPSGGGTGAGAGVNALAVSGNNLYVGGAFNGAGAFFNQVRNYLGSTTTAGVLNSWDPNANNTVNAITTVGSAVIIGGTFTTINGGTAAVRLAIVDANTGVIRP